MKHLDLYRSIIVITFFMGLIIFYLGAASCAGDCSIYLALSIAIFGMMCMCLAYYMDKYIEEQVAKNERIKMREERKKARELLTKFDEIYIKIINGDYDGK